MDYEIKMKDKLQCCLINYIISKTKYGGKSLVENNIDFISQIILDIKNVKFNRKILNAYNVFEVDQFLDDLINCLENNTDYSYELKKIEYMINEKNFSYAFSGYNPKEVDSFLESLMHRTKI